MWPTMQRMGHAMRLLLLSGSQLQTEMGKELKTVCLFQKLIN